MKLACRVWVQAGLAMLLCAALSACGGGAVASAGPLPVAAVGDSITWRTGQCTQLQGCDASASWATYLLQASGGSLVVTLNAGRGGDTCTPQEAWAAGVFAGQARGVLGRLKPVIDARPAMVLLLIGINDVLAYNVPPAAVAACVVQARAQLQAAGIVVLVLTYPPVMASSPVWGLRDADVRTRELNAALQAVGALDTAGAWPDWAAALMTADGGHPTPAGAAMLAWRIASETTRSKP